MEFPILKEEQVVVVIADGATGIILNCNGEIYKNDSNDNVYWSFDNIDLAKDFINIKSTQDDKIEFIIYDKNQVVLEFIEATHWKS